MTQTLMAWQNVAKAATVIASSAEETLPATNMINDVGDASTGWQSMAGVTTATLTFTLDTTHQIRVVALLRSNLSPFAQVRLTIVYDGGETWTGTLPGPAVGYGQVIFVLSNAEYADAIEIEIEDTGNTQSFLNVALAFIGDAWLPSWSVSPSSADNWVPEINRQITRGGQIYQTSLSNPRTYSFEFGAVDPDETYAAAREMGRLASMGTNVLFIPDAEGSYIEYDAIFGIVSSIKPYGYLPGPGGVRTWGATIIERL